MNYRIIHLHWEVVGKVVWMAQDCVSVIDDETGY